MNSQLSTKRVGRAFAWLLAAATAFAAFAPALPGGRTLFGGETAAYAAPAPDPTQSDRFFGKFGYPDPYGSSHSHREFFVSAGSTTPAAAICLNAGKQAPPSESMGDYAPDNAIQGYQWAHGLATYGDDYLQSVGIDTSNWMNPEYFWAYQHAAWNLLGQESYHDAGGIIAGLEAAAQQATVAIKDRYAIKNDRVLDILLGGTGYQAKDILTVTDTNGDSATVTVYAVDALADGHITVSIADKIKKEAPNHAPTYARAAGAFLFCFWERVRYCRLGLFPSSASVRAPFSYRALTVRTGIPNLSEISRSVNPSTRAALRVGAPSSASVLAPRR